MIRTTILCLFIFLATTASSQTKVSGVVVDEKNKPVPFVNIIFKNSNEGVLTNEKGGFYIESAKNYTELLVSAIGYTDQEVPLLKAINYEFKIKIKSAESLKEIKIYSGKTSKKNNPAIDILKKIWERKKKNGLYMYDQYQIEKYEKVEFDLNTIDSAFMKSSLFKGMEFVFKQVDTSRSTGKTYLPIFINESVSDVYGDNKLKKKKEIKKANKMSGFQGNEQILSFLEDLYPQYDIYNNYILLFDKSFTSPLSRTGIDVYNYILKDSAFIDNKWCYNIIYYPRRKSELTFKGDFWVNDTTFAIKKISLEANKSANINWVKDIYIEQEFDVENDSVFLISRDYIMTDFALRKKESSRGVYGKRNSFYRNHVFNKEKPSSFYTPEVNNPDNSEYVKPESFWEENRAEKLSKDEKGIYKMLDTLKNVRKFRQMTGLITILASGYAEFNHFDWGPLLSTFGYNDIEGLRAKFGGRSYFSPNDPWRIQGYVAYGFKDERIKYGLSGKVLLEKNNRIILAAGKVNDIEQLGGSLTYTNDILTRDIASSSFFTVGSNGKLTHSQLYYLSLETEPIKNLSFRVGFSHRDLISANPAFKLDYYTPEGIIDSKTTQSELGIKAEAYPKRRTIGHGVERRNVDNPFSTISLSYGHGFRGFLKSNFDYDKLQLYYRQPLIIGIAGRSNLIVEAGKTFGTIPLSLLSIVPGNQSYTSVSGAFSCLKYYEFITDQYLKAEWNHNFHGSLFARVPLLRKLEWREYIGIKAVYGTVSEANRAINASGTNYLAPDKVYWEYDAGITNIFKFFSVNCSWRGSYFDVPDTSKFAVKVGFGFYY